MGGLNKTATKSLQKSKEKKPPTPWSNSNIFPMVFGESETSFRGLFPRSIPVTGLSVGVPGVIVLSWGGWTPEQIQGGPPTIYKWRDMGNPINGQPARPRGWFVGHGYPQFVVATGFRDWQMIVFLGVPAFFSKSYGNTANSTIQPMLGCAK